MRGCWPPARPGDRSTTSARDVSHPVEDVDDGHSAAVPLSLSIGRVALGGRVGGWARHSQWAAANPTQRCLGGTNSRESPLAPSLMSTQLRSPEAVDLWPLSPGPDAHSQTQRRQSSSRGRRRAAQFPGAATNISACGGTSVVEVEAGCFAALGAASQPSWQPDPGVAVRLAHPPRVSIRLPAPSCNTMGFVGRLEGHG
ncbi:hypothetical protein M011DRAFT_456659 [Sporormia fimetaria CBS 119925]|uniref:Uncharacterized protein n=1 Tax=Sporormia fimetaria CBS 119925 TaxID=1340428 RepID=A0A6A6VIG0_9PLEO|nr:hypothetical protein M011DRAFT_456659 [Sporormia fimetaria CBS 119925]